MHAHDPALRLAAIDALGTIPTEPPGAPRAGAGESADTALLDTLGSPEATVRLHAAVALSEAGGVVAREALLAKLDGGDEVDRAAVLTALGGVMARVPSDPAVSRLRSALDLAAGPERDGIIQALGRAPLASAVRVLAAMAKSEEPTDRGEAAGLLAAHQDDATAHAMARALLDDADAGVRAQAAWALGTIGDPSDVPRLIAAARSQDADVAPDAVAAIGRIAGRAHAPEVGAKALCPFGADARPYVRANALAGLALAGARCDGGGPERAALAADLSDDVRAAAALLLSRAPSPDDARALDRCARSDPSGAVAARCRSHAALPTRAHAALVYLVGETATTPRAGMPYAMLMADGTLHAGTADRRGAVFDPVAPEGEVSLRRPSALAR